MSKKNRPSIAERRAAMLAIDAENGGSHLAKPKPDDLAARLDRVAGQPAPAKPERQRLTSVAIPPELLAEIRTEVARRSNEEGRRIGAWELIAEAWNNRPTR